MARRQAGGRRLPPFFSPVKEPCMGAEQVAASAALGLPPDAQDHFQAASLVLRRYGLNLAAAFDPEAGHDVLMARTIPREDLEYRQVVADMGADGAFGPRIKTSYYRGGVRILVFESSPPRPVLEVVARAGEGVTVTVLDPGVPLALSMEGTMYDLTAGAPAAR
jgi:hypothetical protein